jgi:hypothetical protein
MHFLCNIHTSSMALSRLGSLGSVLNSRPLRKFFFNNYFKVIIIKKKINKDLYESYLAIIIIIIIIIRLIYICIWIGRFTSYKSF